MSICRANPHRGRRPTTQPNHRCGPWPPTAKGPRSANCAHAPIQCQGPPATSPPSPGFRSRPGRAPWQIDCIDALTISSSQHHHEQLPALPGIVMSPFGPILNSWQSSCVECALPRRFCIIPFPLTYPIPCRILDGMSPPLSSLPLLIAKEAIQPPSPRYLRYVPILVSQPSRQVPAPESTTHPDAYLGYIHPAAAAMM